ncbi:unnamed protein product [Symbiodinium sp. CCMP2456]|nr:unnamed protein product [Symbiodinium sp. CCMP2456]
MFLGLVSWALIPSKCGLLSRKAWLGADRPVDFVGLLSAVWQLWPRVLSKFTGKPQAGLRPVNSARAARGEDVAENCWDSVAAIGPVNHVGAGSVDASHGCDPGTVEEAAPPDMLNVDADTWAQLNQKNRSAALSFASSAHVAERLVILRQVMEAGLQLLYHQLHVAGPQWEAEQKRKQAETGQRTYKVVDAATGEYLKGFFQQASEMLLRAPRALAKSSYTRRARATMFRLLASLMACVCYFLHMCFDGFPYCLFKLLVDPTQADEILNQRPACMRDSLAATFLQKHGENLASSEALACLHSLAILIDLDISGLESAHSSLREYTMSRGRGHTPDFAQVSAKRLCAWTGRRYGHGKQQAASGGKSSYQKSKQCKQKKHSRPGGAWRAFCSEKARGQKFTRRLIRQLAAEYRDLAQDEYEVYCERGAAATAAARAGNKRPFSLMDSPVPLALRPAEVLERHTDLVVALPGSDFGAQFEALRARLRAGHKAEKSRAAVPPADVPLDTVLQQALDQGGAPGLQQGVRTRPHAAAVPKLQHHCFVPPAVRFAKARRDNVLDLLESTEYSALAILARVKSADDALAFSKSRRSQMEDNQTSMGEWLQNQWTLEHRSLRHEDQPKIPGAKKHASGMGPCGLAGTCSCSRPGDQKFCKKLTQLLRKTLWKRRGVACPARLDYEAGRLVVSLKTGDGEQEVFFFPGYTNYTTWTFAAVLLQPCERQHEDGVMKLVFGEEDTHFVESPWTVLAGLLTMQALVKKFVDVSKPCAVRFWSILEDERRLPVWEMQPRFVDVCLHTDDLAFWKGEARDSAPAQADRSHGILDDMGGDAADDEPGEDGDEEDNLSLLSDGSPAASTNSQDEAVEALLGAANAFRGPDADVRSDASQSEHEVHIPDELLPAAEPVPDAVAALLAFAENADNDADADAPGADAAIPAAPAPEAAPAPPAERPIAPAPEAAPAPPAERPIARAGRAQRETQLQMLIPDPIGGEIRYNLKGMFFTAFCPRHGEFCRRQRQATAGKRAGSGRPLGNLLSWLAAAEEYDTQEAHVGSKVAGHEKRKEVREWFMQVPNSNVLLEYERASEAGEDAELYVVFLRKDVYSRNDVLRFKQICQDIGQKQCANGPLEIFDVLLPECGADYAAHLAKLSSETRGQATLKALEALYNSDLRRLIPEGIKD